MAILEPSRRAPARPDPWLPKAALGPRARLRLFCFPFSGGGASAFRPWSSELPPEIQVSPVQPPGRENRLGEPPYRRIGPLIDALGPAILPYRDVPFAFFGHSLGALVAYELARFLGRVGGPGPVRLLVSACRGPGVPHREPPIYNLPEREFIDQIRIFGGTPDEVLANEELMSVMIPLLRSDYEIYDTYEHQPGDLLSCPISAFGGLEDKDVNRADLEAWQAVTTGACRVRMLPGGHFFIKDSRATLLEAVAMDLAEHVLPRPGGKEPRGL